MATHRPLKTDRLRRRYFNVVRRRRSEFWTARITADQSQPHHLWWSFDQLLGRGSVPSADIDASTLHQFFDDKVAGVRGATADAPAAQYMPAPVRCELRLFTPVTPTEVAEMVRALPDKQCLSDPLPTWILKASPGAIPEPTVLLVTRVRCGSVEDEVCAHNAGTEEN